MKQTKQSSRSRLNYEQNPCHRHTISFDSLDLGTFLHFLRPLLLHPCQWGRGSPLHVPLIPLALLAGSTLPSGLAAGAPLALWAPVLSAERKRVSLGPREYLYRLSLTLALFSTKALASSKSCAGGRGACSLGENDGKAVRGKGFRSVR